jgi:hypothetical protein
LIVYRALRQKRGAAPEAASPAEGEATDGGLPDDPELLPYLARVRELAYGWPSGVKPEEPKA